MAVPERDTVLDILGRREIATLAGMSTRLPEKRFATIDDEGIGVGSHTDAIVYRGVLS